VYISEKNITTSILVIFLSNVLRSIIISLSLVTAVYLMMNVAYLMVLTVPEMIAAPAVAVVIITPSSYGQSLTAE